MEEVVNEVLGDAYPNDRVPFAILSRNTVYQTRNEVTGAATELLFGKMSQCNQYTDNDLTMYVQSVNLLRGI